MRTRHIVFTLIANIGAVAISTLSALTPGAVPGRNDIVNPSEVNHLAIGSDGKTFYAVDIPNANNCKSSVKMGHF